MNDPDQHRDKRQRRDEDLKDEMELDQSVLPTNHNRLPEDPTQTIEEVDVRMEDQRVNPALEQLEKDMDEPFLLSRSSKASPVHRI